MRLHAKALREFSLYNELSKGEKNEAKESACRNAQ